MVFFDYEDRLFREKVRMARTRVLSAFGRDGVYFSRSGCVSVVGSRSPTNWIVDAHRDGMRFIVRADEKLTAFLEPEPAIHHETKPRSRNSLEVSPMSAAQ